MKPIMTVNPDGPLGRRIIARTRETGWFVDYRAVAIRPTRDGYPRAILTRADIYHG